MKLRQYFDDHREAAKVVVIYLLFGLAWIYFSDSIVGWLVQDEKILTTISIFKGFFFIFFTAFLLFFLIVRQNRKIKKSIQERRESEERFRFLVKNSSDSFVILNEDGSQRYVSPAAERITGYPVEELQGRTIDTIIHPEDMAEVNAAWNEVLAHPDRVVSVQYRHIHKTRGWMYSEAIVQSFLDEPAIRGVIATVRDVTIHKQDQEALRNSEKRLRTLFQTVPDLIWLKSLDGVYLSCNPVFERLFGVQEADIKGKIDYDFIDKGLADSFRSHAEQALALGKPVTKEYQLISQFDRSRVLVEATKTPMVDSEGTVVGVLGVGRDITDRKQVEEEKHHLQTQLQQAQKMEAVGTLAGGIAHDFNNILSAVLGYSEMARYKSADGSTVANYLDQVILACGRAKDLINQILTFSRQKKTDIQSINPALVIKEVVKMLRSSIPATIEIDQDIDSHVGFIRSDPTDLHQIVMNLCTNAFHAMEDTGGHLTVILRKQEVLSGFDPDRENDSSQRFIELIVRDTGTGISPDIQKNIFDPYFTTKDTGKGTGMGLAIVHGMVKRVGGEIICNSSPGNGTEFKLSFPEVKREAVAAMVLDKQVAKGAEHILFVDDEEMLTDMAGAMLVEMGYQVTKTTSSLEALRLFEMDPFTFDLLITDQTMPQMTGLELAERMLQIRSDLPIILCTGYSTQVSEERAKSSGIKGFALKPLTRKEISSLVRKVLGE